MVAQGGVGEVGLSIKAASPDAPACRTRLQHLLSKRAVSILSATCLSSSSHFTATIATHRIHLHFATTNDKLQHSTRRHNLRIGYLRRTQPRR